MASGTASGISGSPQHLGSMRNRTSVTSTTGKSPNVGAQSGCMVVLIAIDSSQQAENAFDWYLRNIHQPGYSIVILHCVDLSVVTEREDAGIKSCLASWDLEKTKIKALDDKYRWKLNEEGLPGKIRTESGQPGEVVIKVASQENAGLIVIGSRGLGRLRRAFTGSVSDYVLHHSKCPVIVCKQTE